MLWDIYRDHRKMTAMECNIEFSVLGLQLYRRLHRRYFSDETFQYSFFIQNTRKRLHLHLRTQTTKLKVKKISGNKNLPLKFRNGVTTKWRPFNSK